MGKKYKIFESVVKKLDFKTFLVADIDAKVSYDNRLDVSISSLPRLEPAPSFVVTITIEVAKKVSDKYNTRTDKAMTLDLLYSIIVEMPEERMNKNDIYEILKIKVPSKAFDTLRVLVWNVTQAAGMPYMLPDYDFYNPDNNMGKYKTREEMDEEPVENKYDLMTDEYDKETFASKSNASLSDIIDSDIELHSGDGFGNQLGKLCYKIVYPVYYSFFAPFDYKHVATPSPYSETFWEAFSQVLLGSFETECEIRNNAADLPELVFCYNSYWQKPVSELSFDTALALFNELLMNMRNSYLYSFILEKGNFEKYYFRKEALIPEEEYKDFFGDEDCWSQKEKNLFRRAYKKLKNADLMTFLLNF